MPLRDDSWLSLTPEPERLLPAARAALRSGEDPPSAGLIAAERGAAERLVLAAARPVGAWLRDTQALAAEASGGDGPTAAAALVRDVVANHDALALGLPAASALKTGGR